MEALPEEAESSPRVPEGIEPNRSGETQRRGRWREEILLAEEEESDGGMKMEAEHAWRHLSPLVWGGALSQFGIFCLPLFSYNSPTIKLRTTNFIF